MATIAELLVKIGADNSGLKKTLSESESSIHNAFAVIPIHEFSGAVGEATEGIGGMIGKLSGIAALAATGFGLGEIVKSAMDVGEAVYDLSTKLGISSEEAWGMAHVLKLTGSNSEQFAAAMLRLDKNLEASGIQGDKTRATLALFGVSLTDSHGKLLPLTEQLANMSQGFKLAAENGLQQEFVMETLGVRGMSLIKTLKDYNEASEKAKEVKEIGLDPEKMHELKLNMEALELQAEQIGLAFTGALAPVAHEIFPPIMSGLQNTAAFLSENHEQIIGLTKDALELVIAYKGIQLLASAGHALGTFWAEAAEAAAASATVQGAAADGLSVTQERDIARTVAASNKMYAKMQADAVKTAQAAGLSAEETAAVISEKCVEIATAGTVAAEKIRTEMTSAFLAQAEAARLAAAQTVAADEMAAGAAKVAATAEAELAIATAATGTAAVAAGEKTVGVMATTGAAVASLGRTVWALAGGWLGVAVAIGYAATKLFEYAGQQNEVQAKRYAAHGQEVQLDENGMVIPIYGPNDDKAGMGSMRASSERATDAEIAQSKSDAAEAKSKADLAAQMAAIEAAGRHGTTGVHDHAAAIQRANDQASQLMADLNKRIAGDSEIAYESAMSNITAEVQRMNTQVANITKNGGDASGLADKIAEYQQVAAAKVADTWRRAWQNVKDQAALVNAQLLHDKDAEADAEYQIALTRIEKERKAEFDAIAKSGGDKEAQAQANADAAAKIAAAAQKRDYAKGDNALRRDQQALESAQLQVTIAGKTQAQVDAIRQKGLQTYIADLNAQIAAAGTDADRRLALERQLADAISHQEQIAATNAETAWGIAFERIRNGQTNYADIVVNAWDSLKSTTESTFDKMVDDGMSATGVLRNVFQSLIADIEKMFLRMWEERYVMGPLQELFNGIIGGVTGGGMPAASGAGGLSYIPSAAEVSPIQHFAGGGDASGWAIVGEDGPELAYFGNTAHVYTAGQSAALAGSMQTGPTSPSVNVNVINRSGQQLSVSQQAQYDPAAHTMLMQMFVDGVSKNLAGSRDLLFGRG